jgi:flagellar hook-basal body complex protein FliE
MKLGEVLSSVGALKLQNLENKTTQTQQLQGESFSDILKSALNEVNTQQVQAYEAMEDIATGKIENLQDAIKQIEEAELSLKLGLEVKNKALSAYKQVMTMQI